MRSELKKILGNEGITQAELSRVSGLSTNTINKLCNDNGETKVMDATIGKVVKALNNLSGGQNKYKAEDVFPK